MTIVNDEFRVHMLNDNGIAQAKAIGELFDTFLIELAPRVGNGRAFSIVKTKLEEACFFAKKSMASQPENQKEVF